MVYFLQHRNAKFHDRQKNPQKLSAEDAEELNLEIFPFWMDKNVIEVTRSRYDNPDCLRLFENLVFFIAAKAGCISHAVPAYTAMLEHGLSGSMAMAGEHEQALAGVDDEEARSRADFYRAVQISLEGILDYTEHLAEEAEQLSMVADDPQIQREFAEMAEVCRRVPAQPATTFREAVNAIWLCQVGIHAENINMAMSPGRLDQVLEDCR